MSDPCEINECTPAADIKRWGCLKWLIFAALLGIGLLLLLSRCGNTAGNSVAGPTVTAIPANTIVPPTKIPDRPTSTPRPAATARPAPTAVPEPAAVERELIAPTLGALSAAAVTGELLELSGTAMPNSVLSIYKDGELIGRTFAGGDGLWTFPGAAAETGSTYHVAGSLTDRTQLGKSNSEILDVEIAVAAEPEPEPEPAGDGGLQVVYANADADNAGIGDAPSGAPVLSMILDSSWSMTFPVDYTGVDVGADTDESQRTTADDPSSRIFVAKAGLVSLVENEMPVGMPTSLRVFGNEVGNLACQTSLMVPYGPLDRGTMASTLNGVLPQFNANTAIGASLAAVGDDLAASEDGRRNIILITDGDETCGGDPAAEIAALVDAGFDVTVNIVGFAISDPATKERLEGWATAGNGEYYDAPNADTLVSSLRSIFSLGYSVQDDAGNTVALGTVGGPAVEVPAGAYKVVVNTVPVQEIDVEVAGDGATVVTTE